MCGICLRYLKSIFYTFSVIVIPNVGECSLDETRRLMLSWNPPSSDVFLCSVYMTEKKGKIRKEMNEFDNQMGSCFTEALLNYETVRIQISGMKWLYLTFAVLFFLPRLYKINAAHSICLCIASISSTLFSPFEGILSHLISGLAL